MTDRIKSPSTLRVNGRHIDVHYLPAAQLPGLCGNFVGMEGRINLLGEMNLIELQDTLLHEVMHAIRYTQGREFGGEVEEDYVRSLATGLIGVLHDNPVFSKWLLKVDKHD